MGKDLRGKELGVGISQRKDGLYTARFTGKSGKRYQKYFPKLQECRQWLADAQFEDEHGSVLHCKNPTVDAWYKYWIDNVKGNNIRDNTRRNYNERYERNIKPYLGEMLISEVKPIHCQNVLNRMSEHYANSVIGHSRLVMYAMFDSAVENELLPRNPVTKSVKCTSGRKSKEIRALTLEEQKILLETVKETDNYNQYALILQTGLRVGELIGLKWSDVDMKNRVIHVRRTMECRNNATGWRVNEPKTENGIRDIPLTNEAVAILKAQKRKLRSLKIMHIEWADMVFLNQEGIPIKNNSYDSQLHRCCNKTGLPRISMHILRHTFATRCIEGGMKPKTLQMLLGHSSVVITMNLYVHITDDEKRKEVEEVEAMLKLV